MAKYFGTNGIRAKLDLMTPEFVSRMAFAFGRWTKGKNILLARDTRLSGPMLRHAAISGLMSAGCNVTDLGIVPAPTAELMVHKLKADGAITITASHNPPEWNALKFVDRDSVAVSWERGEEIEKIFEDSRTKRAEWNHLGDLTEYPSAIDEHIDEILKYTDVDIIKKKKPRIVLDCANGTASFFAPKLFRQLGCQILTLNAQPDGYFPGHNSEPTEENLSDLIASVMAVNATMGIAWDGDCDRVIFIDEKGGYIIGDKSYALSVKIALKESKVKSPKVVSTVATTDMIKDITKDNNGTVVYTKVGGPYLAEKLIAHKAVSGGEEAGGIIWPKIHPGKDGFITAARILEYVCRGKPLSKMINELPKYYNAKVKIYCAAEEKVRIIEQMKSLPLEKGVEALTVDGVRFNTKNGWCILRPSGTEHLIRIFAESTTPEKANELLCHYQAKVKKLLSGS